MAQPGEVQHKIGEAYLYVFLGALEASIKPFRYRTTIYETPEKLTFEARPGKSFSYDARGDFYDSRGLCDVFLECKGYEVGDNLLTEFKSFLAKAYLTSAAYKQHRNDLFWFITNVPFACDAGRKILSPAYVKQYLSTNATADVKDILGTLPLDDSSFDDVARRTGIFILTDSFLRTTDINYTPKLGEYMWMISKRLHGGSVPRDWPQYAAEVARTNGLESPDLILAGKTLRFPWRGVPSGLDAAEY